MSSFRKVKLYTVLLPEPKGWCSELAGPGPATSESASPCLPLSLRCSHGAEKAGFLQLLTRPNAAHLLDALVSEGVPERPQVDEVSLQVLGVEGASLWTRGSLRHKRSLLSVRYVSVLFTRTSIYEERLNYFEWHIYLMFIIFTS